MIIKIRWLFTFWLLSILAPHALAGPFSHCELSTRSFTADNMEFVNTPASFRLSSETGIQILTIKQPLTYNTIKYRMTLEPVHLAGDKFDLTNDVATFLNALPKDFLIKARNICFVLVEDTGDAEAMATKNVVFLPIDATFEAMAHEFMHAVDDIYDQNLNYEDWDAAAGNCQYNRNVNINQAFPEGSEDQKCFITPYAKTDLWEDRAEIFSALYRNKLSTDSHEAILNKADALKSFLRNISPSMNESFWNTTREFSW